MAKFTSDHIEHEIKDLSVPMDNREDVHGAKVVAEDRRKHVAKLVSYVEARMEHRRTIIHAIEAMQKKLTEDMVAEINGLASVRGYLYNLQQQIAGAENHNNPVELQDDVNKVLHATKEALINNKLKTLDALEGRETKEIEQDMGLLKNLLTELRK